VNSTARPRFSWSDAWLLHAVAFAAAHHAASLREIIGMGDAIEKSVFSFEELSSGLAKLEAAGHIRSVGGGFELNPVVEEQFCAADTHNDREARVWFERFLSATRWSPQAEREGPDPAWRYPGLTKEAVDAAFGEHNAEMEAVLRKLEPPGA
jgi:hypothetical protein